MPINLDNLEVQRKDFYVYYLNDSLVVYKNRLLLQFDSCDGSNLASIRIPVDSKKYSLLDLDTHLVFMFSGQNIVLFDKRTHDVISYQISPQRIGRCISQMFHVKDMQVCFGTMLMGRVQFVTFDVLQQSRVCQSMSWGVKSVSDTISRNNLVYGVLDKTFMTCCDMNTGENIWTRFETGYISTYILEYNQQLLYACQGLLKIVSNKKSRNIQMPLMRIHSLLCIVHDDLFFTSNDGKNLCCYDLKNEILRWEIPGNSVIKDFVLTNGKYKSKVYDIMLLYMTDLLGVINLSIGKAIYNRQIKGIYGIKKVADHILIHKTNNETEIIEPI